MNETSRVDGARVCDDTLKPLETFVLDLDKTMEERDLWEQENSVF